MQYKHFKPVQKGRNTIGFNLQGSFLAGYGGVVAPPFERFYLGGENDIRGFDIRSVSPVAFLPDKGNIILRNPDGTAVPRDPRIHCAAATPFRFRWSGSYFPAVMPAW